MADAAIATLPEPRTTHLGVVAGLAMGPAVGLGLGRFAYALLLPAMRADLGWSYAQAGALNTANAAGYLVGALLAAPLAARIGDKRAFLAGLALATVTLLANGAGGNYVLLMLLRALAGAAGAVSLITGGALASAAGGGGGRGRAALTLGVYFGGAGFGMVVSAVTVPMMAAELGWRSGWLVLGLLGVVATFAALPALARTPDVVLDERARGPSLSVRSISGLHAILVSYVLFGAGYIAYTTFIVAYLSNRLGFGAVDVTLFWGCAGLAATGAGVVWGPVLSRLSGGRGVALANTVVMLGAVLPVLLPLPTAVFVSAVVFGGSFLIVPTSVTAFVRKAVVARLWTGAIAALTVGFAIGQCVGPWLSGVVSDSRFGVAGGLLLSGVVLAAAAAIALVQREPRPSG